MPSHPFEPSARLTGGTGRIEGVVQDLESGVPLAGATVMIRPCSVKTGNTTRGSFLEWTPFFLTDADGAFHIEGLPEGRFHIEARADGHLPHRLSPLPEIFGRRDPPVFEIVWLNGHSSAWDEAWNEAGATEPVLRNQFPQVSAGQTVRIEVKLRPGRVISGHVRDASCHPVAGATVTPSQKYVQVEGGCFSVNDLTTGATDAQGAFQVAVFPGADVEFLVTAPGFAALHCSVSKSSDAAVEITLVTATVVRGRVVRADGRVALRTRVAIFDPTDLATKLTADADETGAWSIENAPPPPFAILAWHGYSGAYWTVVVDPTSELDLVLRPLRTVRGTVVGPDASPVQGDLVNQVFPFEWKGRQVFADQMSQLDLGPFVSTDENGRFTVRAAPDADGKILLHYDYYKEPARVDGPDEARLVVSEKMAQSWPRAERPEQEPQSTSPPCPLPKAPESDLSPADFESRNRLWIAMLQTDPPAERVAMLKRLYEEISGGGG